MQDLLERFKLYCECSGIDLDNQYKALQEEYRVDVMDVNDKFLIKINMIKNALKGFLESENQKIDDNYLEFIIKLSNLV